MSGRQAMVFEHQDQDASQRAAITSMAHSSACPERPADEKGIMGELPEYVDGPPNLCGSERLIEAAIQASRDQPVFGAEMPVDISGVDSAFAVALHMHQPLIPAGGPDLRTAAIVSNLQWMLEHPEIGDNHNAPVFHWCYRRMGELIPRLLAEGRQPQIMLEYSGTLLHGLRRAGLDDGFDALMPLARNPDLYQAVEWLGCPWGHAVAPSTPTQDYRLVTSEQSWGWVTATSAVPIQPGTGWSVEDAVVLLTVAATESS